MTERARIPRRIRHERGVNGCPGPVPSRMTVHRILLRHGLIDPTVRRRRRQDYRRWQRDTPMQLWQLGIVGGLMLDDGSGRPAVECKVVAGVDDHSRYCVIAAVVPRATGRAVCLARLVSLALVTRLEAFEDGASWPGEFGFEGHAPTVDLDGR